jgi:DNA repair exonuclease SbcCD ATPase subunit
VIVFKTVRWKNLLSTGNSFTEIKLNEAPSALIVGENGAGKSTFIEAISYALYGKPFRKINKPQLINSINNKNLLVEIEFSIGTKDYVVRRGIKPTVFEIIVDGKLLNQEAAARDYQEILEKNILRLSHKSFSQIITLGSSTFIPFMQLPAHLRREFIEDLLDIQIFSTMNILLKTRIQDNKDALQDCTSKIALCEQKIELNKKHLETLRQNNEELIEVKKLSITKQEDAIIKLSGFVDECQSRINSLKEKLEELVPNVNKHKAMTKLHDTLKRKLENIEKEISFYNETPQCPMCKQDIHEDFHNEIIQKNEEKKAETIDAIDKIIVKIEELSKDVLLSVSAEEEILDKEKEISAYRVDIRNAKAYANNIKEEIEVLKSQQNKIENDSSDLNRAKEELKETQQLKEDLTNKRSLLNTAAILLKDGGIKTKIIKQYVPIMNKLISKYLAAMDFFVQFELDENFDEKIKSRFRDEFSYESFSEGEKMRIDLALLFTWRAVSKLRNSASTNLLIMDEVFDSSLDSSGTEEFFKILNGVTADTNVFIISHKGDQLFDKFSNVIKFEKQKNFSTRVE